MIEADNTKRESPAIGMTILSSAGTNLLRALIDRTKRDIYPAAPNAYKNGFFMFVL